MEQPSYAEEPRLWRVNDAGELVVSMHPGQGEAYMAEERIVLVLAGTQSGKTVSGPIWLLSEMQRRGAGDYAIAAPTFALMELKCIPEFRMLFEETLKLGKYYQAPIRKFVFNRDGIDRIFGGHGKAVVYFGFAENPDSLESSTYKAVWADEAGQRRFKLDSWDALQRRLAIHQGRALITTTPYEFGWLKTRIYDRAGWRDGQRVPGGDPEIRVVRFESVMNPAFSREEFERQRRTLPPWKFDMMYRAIWRRPAGTIYDCFDPDLHLVPPFPIPDDWPRILGIDFGTVNLAACFFAIQRKTGKVYIYRTYQTGSKSAYEHVQSLTRRERGGVFAVGGAPSEDEWRNKFGRAGLPVARPVVEGLENGIDAVYEAIRSGKLFVFSHLEKFVDDMLSYSRELDDNQEPTSKIANKDTYHRLDALRYGLSEIVQGGILGAKRINTLDFKENRAQRGITL